MIIKEINEKIVGLGWMVTSGGRYAQIPFRVKIPHGNLLLLMKP